MDTSRTYDFSDLVDAAHGKLSGSEGYQLGLALLDDPELLAQFESAVALSRGMGSSPSTPPTLFELAEQLARESVPKSVWQNADSVELMLASLQSIHAKMETHAASQTTRRRLERAAGLSGPSRLGSRWWLAGLSAAAVAVLAVGIAWNTPASQSWAIQAGLNRGTVWRMPTELRSSIEQLAGSGTLAAPVFADVPGSERVERARRELAPVPLEPRWETVARQQPVFRWDAGPADEVELLLLDEARELVWCVSVEGHVTSVTYPADEPSLDAGSTYYWKVNRVVGGELVASPYAGFKVLAAPEADSCLTLAESYAEQPLLSALALDRCGLYSLARRSLQQVDGSPAGLAREALQQLDRKQQLSD